MMDLNFKFKSTNWSYACRELKPCSWTNEVILPVLYLLNMEYRFFCYLKSWDIAGKVMALCNKKSVFIVQLSLVMTGRTGE